MKRVNRYTLYKKKIFIKNKNKKYIVIVNYSNVNIYFTLYRINTNNILFSLSTLDSKIFNIINIKKKNKKSKYSIKLIILLFMLKIKYLGIKVRDLTYCILAGKIAKKYLQKFVRKYSEYYV